MVDDGDGDGKIKASIRMGEGKIIGNDCRVGCMLARNLDQVCGAVSIGLGWWRMGAKLGGETKWKRWEC